MLLGPCGVCMIHFICSEARPLGPVALCLGACIMDVKRLALSSGGVCRRVCFHMRIVSLLGFLKLCVGRPFCISCHVFVSDGAVGVAIRVCNALLYDPVSM